jgi:hypothetical protein
MSNEYVEKLILILMERLQFQGYRLARKHNIYVSELEVSYG